MRICRLHLLSILLLSPVTSPASSQAPKITSALTKNRIAEFLDAATPLAPEYRADLIFQLLQQAPDMVSPAIHRQLLLSAFSGAAEARFPFPVIDVANNPLGYSRLEQVDLATSHLDGLNIRTQVISLLLPTNPQLAASLLDKVPLPQQKSFACSDSTVPFSGSYYDAARMILNSQRVTTVGSWPSKSAFLDHLASSPQGASQIAPLASLLANIKTSPAELASATAHLDAYLASVTASDREMLALERDGQLTKSIADLATAGRSKGLSEKPIIEAYRDFLVRSLAGEACKDRTLDRKELVRRYNALLQSSPTMSKSEPLTTSEVAPRHISTEQVVQESIPTYRSLSSQLDRLSTVNTANQSVLARTGKIGEYQLESADLEDVLTVATSPIPSDARCPVCEFEGRQTLFVTLLSNVSPGSQLERVLEQNINYGIAHSPVQETDPPCWLKVVKNLINTTRTPGKDDRKQLDDIIKTGTVPVFSPNGERQLVLTAMEKTNDPVLHAYVLAERLINPPYQMRIY